MRRALPLSNNATNAKAQIIAAKMNNSGLDSEKAFFAMVRHEVNRLSGRVLNSELAVFEGGWLMLFIVFENGNTPDFLFAMSNRGKNICAIALDSDPSCPEWLIEFAGQIYSSLEL